MKTVMLLSNITVFNFNIICVYVFISLFAGPPKNSVQTKNEGGRITARKKPIGSANN